MLAVSNLKRNGGPLIGFSLKRQFMTNNNKASKEEVLDQVEPVVVYLPNMTCVGMNFRAGWAGGDTTICYDKNGRKVLHYVNGD